MDRITAPEDDAVADPASPSQSVIYKSSFYYQQAADLRWLRSEETTQLQIKQKTTKNRQHADLSGHSKLPAVKKNRRKTIRNGSLRREDDFIFQNEVEFQAFKSKYDVDYTDEAFETPVPLSEVHDMANKTLKRRQLMYSTAYRNKVRMRNLNLPTSVLNIVANSVNSAARRKSGVVFDDIVNALATNNIVLPPAKPFLSKLTRHQPRDHCQSDTEESESVDEDHTFTNTVRPSISGIELPLGSHGTSVFGSDRGEDSATNEDRLTVHQRYRSRSMPSTSYTSNQEIMVRAALARGDYAWAKEQSSNSRRRSMVEQTTTLAYQQPDQQTKQKEQEAQEIRETRFYSSRKKSSHELVNSAIAKARRGPVAALQRQPVGPDHSSDEDIVHSEVHLQQKLILSITVDPPSLGHNVPQIVVGEMTDDIFHHILDKQDSKSASNAQQLCILNEQLAPSQDEIKAQPDQAVSQTRLPGRTKRHWEPLSLAAAAETRRTIIPTRLISVPQISVEPTLQQKLDTILPPIPKPDRPGVKHHTNDPNTRVHTGVPTSNPEYSDYTAQWHADLESRKQKELAVASEQAQTDEEVVTYYYYDHRLGSWAYATEQRPVRGSSACAKDKVSVRPTGWDAIKALPRIAELKIGGPNLWAEDVRESSEVVRRLGLPRSVRFWKPSAPSDSTMREH